MTLEAILERFAEAYRLARVEDLREKLPVNKRAPAWNKRDPANVKGMVFHQALGGGSLEQIAAYHIGADSHLRSGGVRSISYTFGIRKSGAICVLNDLEAVTWSQGTTARPGDENSEFFAVVFEGRFAGPNVEGGDFGPTAEQIASGSALWLICRDLWNWNSQAIHGHFDFGKPSCPGGVLETIVKSFRNAPPRVWTAEMIQSFLATIGLYHGQIDGILGPKSMKGIRDFQRKAKLKADGIWGPKTIKAAEGYI